MKGGECFDISHYLRGLPYFLQSELDFQVKFIISASKSFTSRHLFIFVPCFNAGNIYGAKVPLNDTGKD